MTVIWVLREYNTNTPTYLGGDLKCRRWLDQRTTGKPKNKKINFENPSELFLNPQIFILKIQYYDLVVNRQKRSFWIFGFLKTHIRQSITSLNISVFFLYYNFFSIIKFDRFSKFQFSSFKLHS